MSREGGDPQGSTLYIHQRRLPTASVEKRIGGEPFIFGYMHHKRAINIGFLTANIAIKRKTQIPYLQLLRKSQRVKPPS